MRIATLILLGIVTIGLPAQAAMSTRQIQKIESTMAEWLASPLEFNATPKRTKYLATGEASIAGEPEPVPVHIVEYEMPDGTYGKGFVNPVTWSFAGNLPYDKLTNEQLVLAYSGWLWLFAALQNGQAQTEFRPVTDGQFRQMLQTAGFRDITLGNMYRVADSEFFEFVATRDGEPTKGAGSGESYLALSANDPAASLPVVYTFLAKVMRGEL